MSVVIRRLVAVLGWLLLCASAPVPCATPVTHGPAVADGVSLGRLGRSGHLIAWRDNRSGDGGAPYVSFVDSLREVPSDWPLDGVRIGSGGAVSTTPVMAVLGKSSAVIVWSALGAPTGGRQAYWGSICSSALGASLSSITADTLTDRPGSQVPVAVVPQDSGRAVVIIQDRSTGSGRALIKQVAIPGSRTGGWPQAGVVIADEASAFPGGLSPVAACTDDSAGCLVLVAGTVPIDLFHFDVTFLVFRLLPDGVRDPRWPVSGLVVTTRGDEFNVHNELVPDGNGGAYVAWTSGNHNASGGVRVLLQRVDRDGIVHAGWVPGGRVAATSELASYQWYPRLVAEGPERVAVMLTEDSRVHRVQAVTGEGTTYPGWPDSGRVIGGEFGAPDESRGRLVACGESTLVACWDEAPLGAGSQSTVLKTTVGWSGQLLPGNIAGGEQLCPGTGSLVLEALDGGPGADFSVGWIGSAGGLGLGRFSSVDGALALGIHVRLLTHRVEQSRVTMEWSGESPVGTCLRGLRSVDHGSWALIDTAQRVSASEYVLVDQWPSVMTTLEYALGAVVEGGVQVVSDTLCILASTATGALRVSAPPVQAGTSVWAYLSLPSPSDKVELRALDVSGRCLLTMRIGRLDRGMHLVELKLPRARSGVVFLSATTQHGRAAARVILLE